ncbi:hypothetical protein HPB51_028599 [Rhipicephalus microplus]|uniref:Transposase Helix-turn-helix domain-containing protein n=1 Tax=Rhipicephalus microplus TaxID=6941 RepID=A0A9J6CWK7_RHIMP|nr:hypothetical protein HPB51_028599 [Rhipicephalus microplus]
MRTLSSGWRGAGPQMSAAVMSGSSVLVCEAITQVFNAAKKCLGDQKVHPASGMLTDSALTCAHCQQTGLRVFDNMDADRKRRLAAMAVALCEIDEERYSFRRKQSCWQKDWVERKELGVENLLYKELLKTDHEEYRRLLRVTREQFLQLLSHLETRIRKEDTVMRHSISAETRLQVTLRYFASGESQHSLSCQFRLGHSSVNDIYETCRAIYEELGGDFIKTPCTEEE